MNLNTPGDNDGPTSEPVEQARALDAVNPDTTMTGATIAGNTNPNQPSVRKLRSKVEPEKAPSAKGVIRSAPSALVLARQAKKDYSAPVGRRVQTMYPVGRPGSKFLRVHPDKSHRQPAVLTYKDPDTDEVYYVSPDLEIPESYGVRLSVSDLYAGVTHDATHFIWNVNRSETTWYRSALKAVNACVGNWYKVVGRKGPNIYDLYPPADRIPEPDWSGLPPFEEMLLSAFDSRMIEELDHPQLRKARGCFDVDE